MCATDEGEARLAPTGGELLAELTRLRREDPGRIAKALHSRRRRPLLGASGTVFLVAADHAARGVLAAGSDPRAMGDRGELLRRVLIALERTGVDGVMATPDVVEDLALLGALENRLVFGSMNRGGLGGSAYELDDRFTAYTPAAIGQDGLDGGKMMVRVADDDPGSLRTLTAAAAAVGELAGRRLVAMIEVFASRRVDGRATNLDDTDALIRAVNVASALGPTSAYTWLKLPVVEDLERLMASTSLPVVLLGGDPGADAENTFARWTRAMTLPQVVGLVAGRALLYPKHGDVARAVDDAAAIVSGRGR